jgi:hypothetical protein
MYSTSKGCKDMSEVGYAVLQNDGGGPYFLLASLHSHVRSRRIAKEIIEINFTI